MIELFSCRNCVQNCGQSLNIGRGHGFCLQHNSVIADPGRTTCKYLHRKDLPRFVVDEGIREHAAEFSLYPALVRLDTKEPVHKVFYSEKFQWEHGSYDALTQAIAQYFKASPAWAFIQSFSGGVDGRRSLAHASFVRRYMHHCDRWESSYRLVLGLIQEIDTEPIFAPTALLLSEHERTDEIQVEASWDVVFSRLASVQEYGWHAGIEALLWASDGITGLSDLNWSSLKSDFQKMKGVWTEMIIRHAKEQNAFFGGSEYYDERDHKRSGNEEEW